MLIVLMPLPELAPGEAEKVTDLKLLSFNKCLMTGEVGFSVMDQNKILCGILIHCG